MNTRIKELRTALHLTLEGFGDRIGVTRAAVSKWEMATAALLIVWSFPSAGSSG